MELIKEVEFWLRGMEDHGEVSDSHIIRRIIKALEAGQVMRDSLTVRVSGVSYNLYTLTDAIHGWDEATKEEV